MLQGKDEYHRAKYIALTKNFWCHLLSGLVEQCRKFNLLSPTYSVIQPHTMTPNTDIDNNWISDLISEYADPMSKKPVTNGHYLTLTT